MTAQNVFFTRRPFTAVAAAVTLAFALSACSEAVLEVGETSVESAQGSADATPSPGEALSVDPELAAVRTAVGAFSLQLPVGWSAMEGIDAAESGDSGTVSGAALYSTVPAAGKDQAAWMADLMAGTSGVTGTDGELTQLPTIMSADGREMFHLSQDYADNRAHLYGYVEGEALHLLRFGLDGTEETVTVIDRSVATAVHVTPSAPAATS